jgi:spermidine synthase
LKPVRHGARSGHGTLIGKELYRAEDSVGSIVVTQRGNKRLLSFGSGLEQSSVLMTMPHYLIHQYTQIMLLGLLFVEARRMTLLGLGGGALVHCLSHYFPGSAIEVIEIRQTVIDIAHEWFDLPRRDNLHVINADALHYLSNLEHGKTDIIFSDLYVAEGMSACQAQLAFITAGFNALSELGCLVINFHQKPDEGSELMAAITSLFSEIIIHDSELLPGQNPNSIMFCCKQRVTLHTPDLNWRAEQLAKQVKMPLKQYYRQL